MLNEEEAKAKLEKDAGISFGYSQARYDEHIKKWSFFVENQDGKRLFRANCKEDFEPYIALSKHLNIECEELLSKYIWVYGDELEAGIDEDVDLYCYTRVGWLYVKDIEDFFLEKFGKYAKNYLLHNETWKLVIHRNECSSSTYKKNEKPGFPPVNTNVSLKFEEIKEKVIKIEKEIIENIEAKITEEELESKTNIEKLDNTHSEILQQQTTEEKELTYERNSIIDGEKEIPFQGHEQNIEKQEPSTSKEHEEIVETYNATFNEEILPENDENIGLILDETLESIKSSETKSIEKAEQNAFEVPQSNDELETPTNAEIHESNALEEAKTSEHRIYFELNGGIGRIDSIKVKEGNFISLPDGSELKHKDNFVCWNTEPDASGGSVFSYDEIEMGNTDITLYAIWGKIMYVHAHKVDIFESPNDKNIVQTNSIYKCQMGEKLLVCNDSNKGEDNLWVKVITEKGLEGYVDMTYLRDFFIKDVLLSNMNSKREVISELSKTPELNASETYFLTIVAKIQTYADYKKENTFVKLITLDGKRYINRETSPEGFTCEAEIGISKGEELYYIADCGREDERIYISGEHKVEIWNANTYNPSCKKICLASKTFTIEDDESTIPQNSLSVKTSATLPDSTSSSSIVESETVKNDTQENNNFKIFIAVFGVLVVLVLCILFREGYFFHEYTVNFDVNGGYGNIGSIKAKSGVTVRLPYSYGIRNGEDELIGWSTDRKASKNLYKPGLTFEMEKNLDGTCFYAIWGYDMYVKSKGLHIRKEPYYSYIEDINKIPIVSRCAKGDTLKVLRDTRTGERKLWVKVMTSDRKLGYVNIEFLTYIKSSIW